ncbi:MAG: RusA family crossover junction endodeoxyribonuclease [Planctomycetes bacterium]|nr:RusA family crossover junction endodeoxyribonuclease [Planctomycetota bacterium]
MADRVRTISAEEFRRLATGRPARVPRLSIKAATPPAFESELPLRISLPFLPPSVNKLFASVRDERGTIIRVLTAQARRMRKLICALVRGRLDSRKLYELHVDIHLAAFTRDGNVRQVDVTNRVKFLEDCLCHALGIDDRQFFKVVLTKHHAQAELTQVTINRYQEAA